MMRSTSAGSSPAQARARRDATVESSIAETCEIRRSCIPVREVIHSSEVSRKVERSALVRTAGGMQAPQPVMAAWVMVSGKMASPAPDATRSSGLKGGTPIV